jgi:hypothetical protein
MQTLVQSVIRRDCCEGQLIPFPRAMMIDTHRQMLGLGVLRIRIAYGRGIEQPAGLSQQRALKKLRRSFARLSAALKVARVDWNRTGRARRDVSLTTKRDPTVFPVYTGWRCAAGRRMFREAAERAQTVQALREARRLVGGPTGAAARLGIEADEPAITHAEKQHCTTISVRG